MAILTPKFVALDSATLGNIARDYFSTSAGKRSEARSLVDQLRDAAVHITVSRTQLFELLGHDDESVAKARIAWLRSLPFVAWIRPYREHWFVGGMLDVALRELHAFVYDSAREWSTIIAAVRSRLLETGVGSDMFVDDPDQWSAIRLHAQRSMKESIQAASVARLDPGGLYATPFSDLEPMAELPRDNEKSRSRRALKFMCNTEAALAAHGDKRLPVSAAATNLVRDMLTDVDAVEAIGGDPYQAIMHIYGVPKELVTPRTTIGEIGELAVYAANLRVLAEAIQPAASLGPLDVPPNSLPSLTLERELLREHHTTSRVSGSDVGDAFIAPLAFYVDAVEADKRTYHHLGTIRRRNASVDCHLRNVFRSGEYAKIPETLAQGGVI